MRKGNLLICAASGVLAVAVATPTAARSADTASTIFGAGQASASTANAAADRRRAKRAKRLERMQQNRKAQAVRDDARAEKDAAKAEKKATQTAARAARRGEPVTATGDDILVTGTRIASNGGKTGSPVTSIGKQELRRQGLAHLSDAINQLPQARPVLGNINGIEGGGQSPINLRGIGSGRTLILVNGQRATNDTNAIPGALVERVDVLTGGASAVYGSDAIGGVVNIILKRNFTGVVIDGELQVIQHTNRLDNLRELAQAVNIPLPTKNSIGGPRGYLNASTGFNFDNDRGNLSVNAGVNKTANLLNTAFDNVACGLYGRVPYSAPPGTPNNREQLACYLPRTANPYGLFRVFGNQNTGSTNPELAVIPIPGVNYGEYSNAIDGTKRFRAFSFNDEVPINQPNYIYREDERYYGGGNLHYNFTKDLQYNVNFQYTYYQNDSESLNPDTIFTRVAMNCDNPLLSAQQARLICGSKAGDANTFSNMDVAYRPQGFSNKFAYEFNEQFLTNQLVGKITPDIRFEINANFRRHIDDFKQDAYYSDVFNVRAFTNAIRVRSVDGKLVCLPPQNPLDLQPKIAAAQKIIDAACRPLDIFSANPVSQDLVDSVVTNPGTQRNQILETVYNGTISGSLGKYGIKSPFANEPAGFAVTLERRTNKFAQSATGFNSLYILPFSNTFTATEIATELSLPLVQDKPLLRYLQINGAYRQGSYKTIRAVSAPTWRLGANWAPVNGLSFRGSYSQALRAPIGEAFDPNRVITNEPLFDPCSPQPVNGAVKRLTFEQCARTGVTRVQYDALSSRPTSDCDFGGGCRANILVGGNPALKPEESSSVTVGVTYAPSFIPNFDVSIDLYKIKVTGFFFGLNVYDAFRQCLNGLTFYCSIYNRDPVTGRLDTPGAFGDRRTANGGFSDNRGMDVAANYRVDLASFLHKPWGEVGLSFNGNLVLGQDFQSAPQVVAFDCTGYFGGLCGSRPAWRHTLRVVWATPWSGLTFNTFWRHTAGQSWSGLSDNPTLKAQANPFETGTLPDDQLRYPRADYFDLGVNVGVGGGSSLRLDISNIFDRRPHIVPNGWLGTEPGIYDGLGRNIRLGFRAQF